MKTSLCIFLLLVVLAVDIDLTPADLSSIQSDEIQVTVQGAVEHPGRVKLNLYDTAEDALNKVQPRPDADLSTVNPQQILKDKDILNIPVRKEATEQQRISINTGTIEDLCTLPGIGEGTAQRIIDYRSHQGLFQTTEDLMKVKGIGLAKYEKLKDLIAL